MEPNSKRNYKRLAAAIVLLLGVSALLHAAPAIHRAATGKRLFKTAPPPKFDQETIETFFPDARAKLGPGQPGGATAAAGNASSSPDAGGDTEADPAGGAGGFAWSKLIAGSAIEDEIKAQLSPVAEATKTPSEFKGGGNHKDRVYFTELAMLFGVIAQYDGDVRSSWKRDALALRDLFKRAGVNCKVGTDNSFKEAKQRSEDLAQLVGGGKIELPKPDPDVKWSDVANRPPLMTRMGKEGFDPRIKAWTADKGEFSKNRQALANEAQLVAVIAHLIQDESYEFADDEGYQRFAKELEKQAVEIVEAIKADSFERAQTAAGQLNKACSSCHADYRS
ncbi:MAG TPA: cytochrome c [Pirellulales bacterium]